MAITVVVTSILLFTSGISAAAEINRDLIYYAGVGTPVIDGERDAIYDNSDTMYAENTQITNDTTGTTATAQYWLLFDAEHLYIYCKVVDTTRSAEETASASATKMDNTDIYILLDPEFNTATAYAAGKEGSEQGQFRFAPNITRDTEAIRASSWGGLTLMNQQSGEIGYNFKGGYTGNGYCFEMMITFSDAYKAAIASAKTKSGTIYLGYSVQINDVTNNDGSRDALIYSNNAQTGLSTDKRNCGKVALNCSSITMPETTATVTTAAPVTEATTTKAETVETTAVVTVGTTAIVTTAAPATDTTAIITAAVTEDDSSGSGGCSSSIYTVPVILIMAVTISGAILTRKKKER